MRAKLFAPSDVGNDDAWARTGGSDKANAVGTNDGDTSYVASSTVAARQEFEWATGHAVDSGMMAMAVRLVVTAKMNAGSGSIKLSVRRGTTSAERVVPLPHDSAFTLTTSYADYSLTFVNQPFPGVHGKTAAWTGSDLELDAYHWGVQVASASGGDVRVTQVRLEVLQRAEVDLDELLTADKSQVFQWAEVEGIRWVPSTRELAVGSDWSAGAYYYGVEHKPCAGTLAFRSKLRGGKINHAKGKEEIETAQLALLDVTEVVHEHQADDGEPVRVLYPQGFYSWLLAYGDQTNVTRTRMVSTTGTSKNTIEGLDPKDWSGSYGREFSTAAALSGDASSSSPTVWACHNTGAVVLHSADGSSWSTQALPASTAVRVGVHGVDSSEVYACGDSTGATNGELSKYDGSSWTNIGARGTQLADIFAVGGELFATEGSSAQTAIRYNGSSWSSIGSVTGLKAFSDIYGTSASNVLFSVRETNYGYVYKWNGSSFALIRTSPLGTTYDSIFAHGSKIWAGGYDWINSKAVIDYYNGSSWSRAVNVSLASGASRFNGIHGTSDSSIWAVSSTGEIYYYNGSSWSAQSSPSAVWNDVWAVDDSNVWVVGQSGAIHYYNGSSWAAQTSGTANDIYNAWGTSVTTSSGLLYIGRETIHANTISGTTVGDSSDAEALERGAFSSLNRAHEWNVQTGVMPEVADHPTCWAGRWVRIWQCAIDPVSGYPLPMSVAQGRLYVWQSHTQTVGPKRAGYTVRLGSAESLLSRTVARVNPARAHRISFAHDVGNIPYITFWVSGTAYSTFFDATSYWDSGVEIAQHAIENAQDVDGNAIPTNCNWNAENVGERVRFTCKGTGDEKHLEFHGGTGVVLGFGEGTKLPAENIDDFHGSGIGATQQLRWTGGDPRKEVYCSRYSNRIYVQDNDADDWPDLADPVASKVRTVLMVGGKKGVLRGLDSTTTTLQNDGTHDYLVPAHPYALARFVDNDALGVGSTSGEGPPSVTVGLQFLDVELHEFFLWMMLSTGFGHNEATYDQLHRWFGLGIDARLVDVTGWERAGRAVPYNWRTWFVLEPVELLELLEEELAFPSGLLLRQDDQGRFLLDWPQLPLPSASATPSILQEHWRRSRGVSVEHSDRMLVNSIVVEMDFDPVEGKYRDKLTANEPNSIEAHGDHVREVKHRGIRSEHIGANPITTSSPHQIFPVLAHLVFSRFAWPLPVIKGSLTHRGLALRPAQNVWVTQDDISDVQDRTATGIAARGGEVLKIDKDEYTGACDVEILTDDRYRKRAGYAPAMMVASFAGSTATVYANKFSDSAEGETDVGFFNVDDAVLVFEGNTTSPSAKATTIASISGNDITFGAALGFTPADGDVIVWGDYDDLVANQTADAYAAVSSGGYVDSSDGVATFTYSH